MSSHEHDCDETKVTALGRNPAAHHGAVNLPPYRASTMIFPSMAAMAASNGRQYETYRYGRVNSPSIEAFETAVAQLEGGSRGVSCPSGMAAIAVALLAYVKGGDHILVLDCVYEPGRHFCETVLRSLGVEVEFVPPGIGADIAAHIRPNTSVIYLEAPGSLTFEVPDLRAIVAAARAARGDEIALVIDNTWATPIFFKPLAMGIDVSIHAATKYIVGHSDAVLGVCVCSEKNFKRVKDAAVNFGLCGGSEEMFLALRGLRTLAVRMKQHEATGLALAEWLAARPEVVQIVHPARPDHPDHAVFKRDFGGASGLFAFGLDAKYSDEAIDRMVDEMRHFKIGFSWGGFESLILPMRGGPLRSHGHALKGKPVRIHAGLEAVADLITDLEAGFHRLNAG
jgi:cystathionine beta-lyase